MVVQPHARKGKSTTETPRERAIHDLVLLRSLTETEPPPQLDRSKLHEKEAEQVLKTTECWERILQQGQTDLRRQASVKQEVGELQQSADNMLDMIQRTRM